MGAVLYNDHFREFTKTRHVHHPSLSDTQFPSAEVPNLWFLGRPSVWQGLLQMWACQAAAVRGEEKMWSFSQKRLVCAKKQRQPSFATPFIYRAVFFVWTFEKEFCFAQLSILMYKWGIFASDQAFLHLNTGLWEKSLSGHITPPVGTTTREGWMSNLIDWDQEGTISAAPWEAKTLMFLNCTCPNTSTSFVLLSSSSTLADFKYLRPVLFQLTSSSLKTLPSSVFFWGTEPGYREQDHTKRWEEQYPMTLLTRAIGRCSNNSLHHQTATEPCCHQILLTNN